MYRQEKTLKIDIARHVKLVRIISVENIETEQLFSFVASTAGIKHLTQTL